MRVTMVVDSLEAGGAETSVVDSLVPLRERGVEIELVTIRPLARTQGLTLPPGVIVTDLSTQKRHHRPVALRRLLQQARPDLVHTMLFAADILGRVASMSLGLPCVSTLANDQYGPTHRQWSRYGSFAVMGAQAVDALSAQGVRRFHAISATVRDSMASRLHIDKGKIDVVYRGRSERRLGARSEARRAAVRRELGLRDDQTVVLHPARRDLQKGVDLSLRAFAVFATSHPELDPVLLIAGRSGNGEHLVSEALAHLDGHDIRDLGERSDVPDLMCASDVLSFPSRWEGLGGTLLEALALELPIVTSDLPAIREACGEAATYSRLEDVDDLARALAQVAGDPHLRHTMVDLGKERFHRRFSIEAASVGMQEFYLRSLGHEPAEHRRLGGLE